jgi:AraC family transcriptional regulator
MVPPGQTISYYGRGGHCRTMRCFLDADLIERHLPAKPVWSDERLAREDLLALGGGEIEWLLRRMYREVTNPDFASTAMIEMLAKQLAVEVIRRFELCEPGDRFHAGGLAPWRMRLIRERVYADRPAPSVEELAGLCDMTVRHLSRAFRMETGKTIGKFVEAVSIERANEKLLRGVPVGEVASSLGYATSGSFATAFRRATGILPSELKAMGRG